MSKRLAANPATWAICHRPTQVGPQIDGIAVMDQVHPLSGPELYPAHAGGQMALHA
jgi:hypothetical protein